jgi:hypothetical protein
MHILLVNTIFLSTSAYMCKRLNVEPSFPPDSCGLLPEQAALLTGQEAYGSIWPSIKLPIY